MNIKTIENEIAVITGASRGIGRDIALTFAKHGASLLLTCFKDNCALNAVAEEARSYGVKVITKLGDVSDQQFCASLLKECKDAYGDATILVNSAGTITRTKFEELEQAEWNRVLDVNLHGSYNMCRQFIPGMKEMNKGSVILLTSQMAFMPHPSASPSYEVSKAGITALVRHLAFQYAPYNVRINSLAPGSIDTDMPKSMSELAREKLRNGVPMKRLGEPEEVAQCALFLASGMSSYVTGTTIHVNGGSLMQ